MDLLFWILTLMTLLGAACCLIPLFIIDLRSYLLPDKYVFPLGVAGAVFHTVNHFNLLEPGMMIAGAALGGGLLWLVRYFGTMVYKQEAMGLGDVKLLLAAGLWLGPEHIINAILIGAIAGLIHGLIVATHQAIHTQTRFTLRRLVIPAGPGFIVGIVAAFIIGYGPATLMILQAVP